VTRLAHNITRIALLILLVTMLAVAANSGTVHAATTLNATTNLALHKPATASSIISVDGEASQAVDGTTTTNWVSAIVEISWLMVDLGEPAAIGRYRVVHANPYETWQRASINLRDFQFQVSQDGQNWLTLDSITDNLADVTDRPVSSSEKYRYVRLYVINPQTELSSRAARIYEFEVYGDGAQDKTSRLNLTLHKPAAVSSVYVASQKAPKAVDGLTTTAWASAISEKSWLMVDLRRRTSISGYRVIHADPFETWQMASINLRDFQFQVSNDAKHWITVDTVTDNTDDITDHAVQLHGRYRYVRLYVTDPQTEQVYRVARVYEFEVFP